MTSSSSAGPIQISKFPEPCVTRNFFEISHGKSVCDGLGATVKNVCYRAVVSGKKVISDASDVFNFCEEKLKRENTEGAEVTISRHDFISLTDVERNRNESEVQTLKGTRKLHAVRSTGTNYLLDTRNLSCYCDSCINNQGDCENREFVCQWERKSLRTVEEKSKQNTEKEQPTTDRKQQSATESVPMTSSCSCILVFKSRPYEPCQIKNVLKHSILSNFKCGAQHLNKARIGVWVFD